jgi:hypothetical protein
MVLELPQTYFNTLFGMLFKQQAYKADSSHYDCTLGSVYTHVTRIHFILNSDWLC